MRIISGWARGRRLASPPGRSRDIRPTADRAKEALFSIIGSKIIGARVLDLYAGTGALGLEALSRGADAIVLVDFHRQALEIIRRNVQTCQQEGDGNRVTILRHDLRKGLPPGILSAAESKQFDLIFLDPPYSLGLSLKTLENLANANVLDKDGIVIVEERSTELLPDCCGTLTCIDQRTYGDTGFWFYNPSSTTLP